MCKTPLLFFFKSDTISSVQIDKGNFEIVAVSVYDFFSIIKIIPA